MKRSPRQQLGLYAAMIFGAAPLVYGFLIAQGARGDARPLWMAGISTVFAAGVLSAVIGRRRSRRAVLIQSVVLFLVATPLGVGTIMLLGATADLRAWVISAAFGASLAAASELIAFSRRSSAR